MYRRRLQGLQQLSEFAATVFETLKVVLAVFESLGIAVNVSKLSDSAATETLKDVVAVFESLGIAINVYKLSYSAATGFKTLVLVTGTFVALKAIVSYFKSLVFVTNGFKTLVPIVFFVIIEIC